MQIGRIENAKMQLTSDKRGYMTKKGVQTGSTFPPAPVRACFFKAGNARVSARKKPETSEDGIQGNKKLVVLALLTFFHSSVLLRP